MQFVAVALETHVNGPIRITGQIDTRSLFKMMSFSIRCRRESLCCPVAHQYFPLLATAHVCQPFTAKGKFD